VRVPAPVRAFDPKRLFRADDDGPSGTRRPLRCPARLRVDYLTLREA
jgi:hypothetical protein